MSSMKGTFVIRCLVLGAFLRATKGENQFFRVRPSDRESVEGADVEFLCHVGNREGDVQWSKDGFLLGFDPKIPGYPRYSMDVNEAAGIYNLQIRNVNFQDEGEYQCQVGPALNHTPIRAGAFLRILIPPEYISVNGLGQSSTVEVKENSTVQLKCLAVGSKPPAQLKWYRDNAEVPKDSVRSQETRDKSRFIATSTLRMRPSVADHGAKFACEAFHAALLRRRMRTEVTLSVLHPPSPPRIEGYEEGTVVKDGEPLTLLCLTDGGNPPPQLVWYRGNAQIDATYFRIGDEATGNNLTLTVTSADNKGAYHCQASNAATMEPFTTSIKLSVYYLASKMWIRGPTEAPRGETITLQCETDVSNPRSEVTWSVDGRPTGAGESVVRPTTGGWVTTSNLTLTLTRQEPDTKTFTCSSKNPQVSGTSSTTHRLRVIYSPKAPSILGYDSGTPLRVGDIQRFNCVSLGGNPPAMLRWFKGDREISTPVITSGSGVSSELVTRVQLSDNGAFYRCEANNSALRKPLSAFVRVAVLFPPAHVNITIQPAEPRTGDNITLTCTSSSSNPMSRLSWKRDGNLIGDHDEETLSSVHGGISTRSRLSVRLTHADDKSQFVCSARSDEFKTPVSSTFVLRVRHLPVFPQPSQTVEILERKSTTVSVAVKAYPEPVTYAWSRNEVALANGAVAQRIVARGALLHVYNVSRDDAGAYQCVAENEEGRANASVVLNVLYGATVVSVSVTSPKGPIPEGSDATLECRASAHPLRSDTITWRLGRGEARSGRASLGGARSVLRISGVGREMRGPVRCVASNGIGEAAVLAAMLDVIYKPLILKTGGGPEGDSRVLHCVVDASPNVTVSWSFNGTLLHADTKYNFTLRLDGDVQWTSTLLIRHSDVGDHGIYTCTAKNLLGYDSSDVILSDKGVLPDAPKTTAVTVRDPIARLSGLKSWWIPAAAVIVLIILVGCILVICCLRKRSNRTTPERSRQTRHIDISDLTADDVCNKLLLSADVKSILLCASEKQHIPLHEFKDHPVFTIEEAYKIDKVRTRHKDDKCQEGRSYESGLKEAFIEEIQHTLDKTKDDCPDILRNEKCLCLSSAKEAGEAGASPGQSDSPESPRFNSTPSGSTGSCLSVYHEKTSIRSLAGDMEGAAVMKLHPIMVLRIDEDSYKFSET